MVELQIGTYRLRLSVRYNPIGPDEVMDMFLLNDIEEGMGIYDKELEQMLDKHFKENF